MIGLPDILEGAEYVVAMLRLSELRVDYDYQRPLSRKKVDDIVEAGYSDIAAGVLLVNVREDGSHYVMDGGHRRAAAMKDGRLYHSCMVWRGLSRQQEAMVYEKCNTSRKQPDALQLFKARLFYGDMKAQILDKAVRDADMTISPYSGGYDRQQQTTRVEAIRAVEYIYDLSDAQTVTYVLLFLRSVWPNDGRAFYDKMLKGFALFSKYYRGKIREDRLREKLQRFTVKEFLRDADTLGLSYDNGPERAIARNFLRVYNSNTKLDRRIQDIIV